jgi:hypothetical protein
VALRISLLSLQIYVLAARESLMTAGCGLDCLFLRARDQFQIYIMHSTLVTSKPTRMALAIPVLVAKMSRSTGIAAPGV